MRNLLVRMSEIFWAKLVLWLPLLIADSLAYWAALGSHLVYNVARTRLLSDSVLTAGSTSLSPSQSHAAFLLIGVICERGPFVIKMVLYLVAIVITARAATQDSPIRMSPFPKRLARTVIELLLGLVFTSVPLLLVGSSSRFFLASSYVQKELVMAFVVLPLILLVLLWPLHAFLQGNLGFLHADSKTQEFKKLYLLSVGTSVIASLTEMLLAYVVVPGADKSYTVSWTAEWVKSLLSTTPVIAFAIAVGLLFSSASVTSENTESTL